jgi:hypothetical protein
MRCAHAAPQESLLHTRDGARAKVRRPRTLSLQMSYKFKEK